MSDELKLTVDVGANVRGKADVDALGQAFGNLGKEAGQSFGQVARAENQAIAETERLNAAFATLGIRSADQIEADIRAVNQALLKLASSGKVTGEAFDRAFAAGQAQIQRFRAELDGAHGAIEGMRKHADGLIGLFGRLGLAFSGAELARQFVTVNSALENMARTFTAISGSSEKAAEEMAYAREVADRLGLPVIAVGKAYADLAAATKGTRVEGEATRTVFAAVSHAMSVAGKSADDTAGALLALAQMASKGVVSMEELRGQLGERLPGALNAVAKGFGITTAELVKLVESGKLTAEQLFPALSRGLDDLYRAQANSAQQTQTLTQRWEHLKNAVADLFKTIGEAGVNDALKNTLERLEAGLVSLSVSLVAAGKNLGVFFGALANGDLGVQGFSARAKEAFGDVAKEAQDKLGRAAQHNKHLESALDASGKAALRAARGHDQAAAGVAQAGNAAAAAATGIVRLNVIYSELAEKSEQAIKLAKGQAEARKAEGAASVQRAEALGIERDQLLEKAAATQQDADATRRLAEEKASDLALHERYLGNLRAEIATRGQASESEQKQLETLQGLIEAKRAEADVAAGQARSAAIAAAAAQAAIAAYADNSQRVSELAAAYAQAERTVAELTARQAEDVALTPLLEDAKNRLAVAGRLYRDALEDQTRAIERNAEVQRRLADVEQATVRLAIERQRTALDVARARGDERSADLALLEIKRLEIRLAELLAQAKKAEADAAYAVVLAKRAEAEAAGQMTEAARAELDAQEASARVKQVEAQIAEESAHRLRELADAALQAGASGEKMGSGFRRGGEALEKTAGSVDRLRESLKGLRDDANQAPPAPSGDPVKPSPGGGRRPSAAGLDPELTVEQLKAMNLTSREIEDYYGKRRLSQGEQAAGLVLRNVNVQSVDHQQIGRQMGFTGAEVNAFAALFGDLLAEEMAAMQQKLRGATISSQSYITEFSGSFDRARQRAADQVRQAQARDAQSAAPARVHRVEIAFGDGKVAQVDTASPDAAKTLIATLKELARRAS